MQFDYEISLDIFKRNYVEIESRQYDDLSRKIKILVTKEGEPITIPSGTEFRCEVKKPDGTYVKTGCTAVPESGKTYIIMTLTLNMLAAHGVELIDIVMEHSGQVLGTMSFINRILPAAVQDDDIMSTSEARELVEAMEEAEDLREDIQSADGRLVNLETGLDDLKSALSYAVETTIEPVTEDIYNSVTWTDGYVTTAGVVYNSGSTYYYTNRVNVSPGDVISIDTTGDKTIRFITAYNGTTVQSESGAAYVGNGGYVVPSGIDNIIITLQKEYGVITLNHTTTEAVYKNVLEDDVGSNTNKINNVTYTEPYQAETETLITPTFTSGYIDTGGTPHSSGSYQYTQKISVSAGNVVSLIATSGTSNMRFICAYAGNSAVSASGISSDKNIYTVPNGIDGVVISCYSASTITKVRILSYSDDTATHIVTIPFGYMMSAGNLSDGNSLTLPVQNSKIYNRLVFDARITSFNSVKIEKNIHSFEVNGTNLILTGYGSTPSVTVAHGLTISDTITILIENNTDEKTNLIRISSKGVEFDYTTPFEYNVGNGAWSVISNGSTLTNCTLSWTSKVIDTNLWLFGDSYFSLYVTRWTYYLVRDGFADNCMLNGFAGENSLDALNGLKNLLIVTSPKYVVWCLGMNDADSSTAVNTNWKNVYDQVINLSKQYGFTPIFSTIPTTPTVNNNFKNAIIRESGYRYIDVDSAVRIANSTSWIDGTMEDTVHPNALGAKIIYNKFLADLPELMITK